MAHPKQFPAVRPRGKGLPPFRLVPIDAKPGPAVRVRVRRCGERRHDHLLRYCFRGVDELRRQQAGDRPSKPPPATLDVLI